MMKRVHADLVREESGGEGAFNQIHLVGCFVAVDVPLRMTGALLELYVLSQGSSKHDVHELKTATDSEHGNVFAPSCREK
ncbi:MAG: hypothetical protein JWM55_211 [Acidimicrobiaceae bacterium]|nr:hypothetical protein [Acidimicrobiaceae bacterium]